MTTPLPSRWLVAASASLAVASATCAIAVGAPLFAPAPRSLPPPARSVVQVPVVVAPRPAPAPVAPACEVHVDLRFAYNVKVPPADILAELAPVLAQARAHPDAAILVDGHADASGNDYGNLVLSKARSHNVALRLVAAGVTNRITERAFGAFVPTDAATTAEQRRVRVTIREPQCHEEPLP